MITDSKIRAIRSEACKANNRILYACCNTALGGFGWRGVANARPRNVQLAREVCRHWLDCKALPAVLPELRVNRLPRDLRELA